VFDLLEVGVADAAGGDLDEDLAGADLGDADLLVDDPARAAVDGGGHQIRGYGGGDHWKVQGFRKSARRCEARSASGLRSSKRCQRLELKPACARIFQPAKVPSGRRARLKSTGKSVQA